MTNKPTDLLLERAPRRSERNTDVTPEQLLEMALDDIRNGEFEKPTRAFILIIDEGESRTLLNQYRANMDRVQEIGYLDAAKMQLFMRWLRESDP